MAHVANYEPDIEYDAQNLTPTNQFRRNLLSLAEEITHVSDMPNIRTNGNT